MPQPTPAQAWLHWTTDGNLTIKSDAIQSKFEDGRNNRVMVISGENGGGKSLAVEALRHVAHVASLTSGEKLEVIDIGMKRRVGAGMERSFIFGHEHMESTGNVSVRTVIKALQQSRERPHDHWIILDEPDIGLGSGYQQPLADYLGGFANSLPDKCLGFVVVTHSVVMARAIRDVGASSLRVGPDLRPVEIWIRDGDHPKTIADLLVLQSRLRETRAKTQAMVELIREERSAAMEAKGMTLRI